MTRWWAQWAWLGGEGAEPGVLIEVEGERITGVRAGVGRPPAGAARLPGLTLPGMANAHSHAFHRLLRGRTHHGGGSFWTWREEMYAVAARLAPDGYHQVASAVFGEMLAAGYTVVGEFHYLHHGPGGEPYDPPSLMGEAVMTAGEEAGIRLTLLDTLYLHGGLDADGARLPPNEVQVRFSDRTDRAWAKRVSRLRARPRTRLGAAFHSVRAVGPEEIEAVGAFAADRRWPLHAHVSEQPAENEQCIAAYGRTPAGLLADLGVLGERFTAVHATHLTEEDVELLGAARSTVCLCPTTERDLADGVGPGRRLAEAGARLAVGSDSHAVVDPFEETRAVELDERLVTHRRGNHPVGSLLEMATAGGYHSLGWPEGGRIAPGALADLVTVSLDSVRLAGAEPDHLLGSVVFAATTADVAMVMVGGRVLRGSTGSS